ncbi:hypothetical protein, partial [Streptomyces europaeiscabiei]|uniref:hypothetical protein n=1 Tax=Streptomyces europaeiscabiei TaxID=146819 RepID=UPI00131D40D4
PPAARPPPLNEALRAAPPGLHDPARWKNQHIGRHVLNGTGPPRRGLLRRSAPMTCRRGHP